MTFLEWWQSFSYRRPDLTDRWIAEQAWNAAIGNHPEDTFRKDAERYRFLRNVPPWKSPVTVVKTRTVGDDIAMLTHEALDATIDACLPQLPAEGKE